MKKVLDDIRDLQQVRRERKEASQQQQQAGSSQQARQPPTFPLSPLPRIASRVTDERKY